jgi:hypothetical protein
VPLHAGHRGLNNGELYAKQLLQVYYTYLFEKGQIFQSSVANILQSSNELGPYRSGNRAIAIDVNLRDRSIDKSRLRRLIANIDVVDDREIEFAKRRDQILVHRTCVNVCKQQAHLVLGVGLLHINTSPEY